MSPPTQWGIFTVFSVSFIMNVSTHLMRDLIPHQVGGDALIRWSPSCGGWGPNSLQVLTKTPFIIVYQAYDYIDMIISCKALQWRGLDNGIGYMLPTILGSKCQLKTYFGIEYIIPTLHYAFSEKEGQKCSTLNCCFSTDFHWKIVKFWTKLS